jgi:predicted DNA-binding transcriptional regulator AlpA
MSDAIFRGERITIKEAANKIGMSPSWIYEQRRKNCLPFDIINPPRTQRYYCDSADIDDYMSAGRITARQEMK